MSSIISHLSVCFSWYFSLIQDTNGEMRMKFESTSLQVNASQVANWTIEVSNMKNGSFTCNISSSQQFARNDQILACPLPEWNFTCGHQRDSFNFSVLPGSVLNGLLAKWAFGVQLECWALNPYKHTIFSGVRPSIWRLTAISVTTAPGAPTHHPIFSNLRVILIFNHL